LLPAKKFRLYHFKEVCRLIHSCILGNGSAWSPLQMRVKGVHVLTHIVHILHRSIDWEEHLSRRTDVY